jgi:hypothetical protein
VAWILFAAAVQSAVFGIMQLDASETNFAETQNLFDNVTGFMDKSASLRSVFKSPARFTAPGFVLGEAR